MSMRFTNRIIYVFEHYILKMIFQLNLNNSTITGLREQGSERRILFTENVLL